MLIMIYKQAAQFLAGIERAGYRYVNTHITPGISDMAFYTDGKRTIILENRGRILGFTVFHSSTLDGVDEELRRIRAHNPQQYRLSW